MLLLQNSATAEHSLNGLPHNSAGGRQGDMNSNSLATPLVKDCHESWVVWSSFLQDTLGAMYSQDLAPEQFQLWGKQSKCLPSHGLVFSTADRQLAAGFFAIAFPIIYKKPPETSLPKSLNCVQFMVCVEQKPNCQHLHQACPCYDCCLNESPPHCSRISALDCSHVTVCSLLQISLFMSDLH